MSARRCKGSAADYPPYVVSYEERERWDLAVGIATQIFADIGPDHVWLAARSIYHGPIPTRTSDDRQSSE